MECKKDGDEIEKAKKKIYTYLKYWIENLSSSSSPRRSHRVFGKNFTSEYGFHFLNFNFNC